MIIQFRKTRSKGMGHIWVLLQWRLYVHEPMLDRYNNAMRMSADLTFVSRGYTNCYRYFTVVFPEAINLLNMNGTNGFACSCDHAGGSVIQRYFWLYSLQISYLPAVRSSSPLEGHCSQRAVFVDIPAVDFGIPDKISLLFFCFLTFNNLRCVVLDVTCVISIMFQAGIRIPFTIRIFFTRYCSIVYGSATLQCRHSVKAISYGRLQSLRAHLVFSIPDFLQDSQHLQ